MIDGVDILEHATLDVVIMGRLRCGGHRCAVEINEQSADIRANFLVADMVEKAAQWQMVDGVPRCPACAGAG